MRITTYLLLLAAILFIGYSCVPAKKYNELKLVKEYYEAEADAADSINNKFRSLYDENRKLDSDIGEVYTELEQLTATNQSLNRSYQDLLQRYNKIVNNNRDVANVVSYEKQSFEEALSARQVALDQKERELQNLEYTLRQRESQFGNVQGDMDAVQSDLYEKTMLIRDLQQQLRACQGN